MNARIDLAISAGLAEHSPAPERADAHPPAPDRRGIRRQLAALFIPLTAVRLNTCERAAAQRR